MSVDKIGVKYIGSFADYSGYGEANRNLIYALHVAGVELTTERLELTTQQAKYGQAYAVCQSLENRAIDFQIKIIHLTPNIYIRYLQPNKYHIGHLFWETDRIPKEWVWNCNRMDEIWTGCEYQKEALIRSGVKVPIFIFPQPTQPEINFKPKPFKIPYFNGYLFYSIFEWIERKNPQALIQAFCEEFTDKDNVGLLLKTYRNNFTDEQKLIVRDGIRRYKLDKPNNPKIFLYENLMSDGEIQRLHATGDCFVSTHRGEGWGRPQAEALTMGKPIISTNCGGIHEWLDDGLAYLCKWERKPVILDEQCKDYESDQVWAEIDQIDLRTKMRYVFENQKEAQAVGKKAQKYMETTFNPLVVGAMMKERLIEISKNL